MKQSPSLGLWSSQDSQARLCGPTPAGLWGCTGCGFSDIRGAPLSQ